jgi:hypothetical protein
VNGLSDRMHITYNGNVGIGTTSPSRKLIVYDTDANVPTIGLRTDGSGATDGFDLQFASSNTFLFNRANGYMAFGTGNTERVRIAATGDTHIGTTAYTGIGGSGYLMVKNVIGLVPDNTGSANNRNWALQANGQFNGSLDFVTSAASASFPNDAYRVSFTRTGGVVASSFTGSFSGSVSAPGSTTQIVYNSGGALAADSGFVYSGSRVGIGINPDATLDVNGNVYIRPAGTLYTNTIAGYSTNLVAMAASTNFVVPTGNVGIGTTNPNSGSLQIYTAASTNQLVLNGGSGYTNVYAGNFLGSLYLSTNYYYSGGHVSDDASKRSMEINMSTDQIYFNTMPAGSPGTRTRLMTISGSQGFIGIGTTSPSYKLDVAGDINTSTGVYRIGGSTILAGTTNVVVGSSGATGTVSLNNTSGAGLVLNGANVGIGTANPGDKLVVDGTNVFTRVSKGLK